MNIETYKVTYNPEEVEGIYAVSLVDDPANQSHFIMLSKSTKSREIKLSSAGEKRLITGVVLIPEQLILRYNESTKKEYNLMFGAEEIRLLSQDFFKNGFQKNASINHDYKDMIKGLTFVESWIVEDPANDKANALGFANLPKGTWMMSAYIEDDQTWEKAKNGEIKGFSIDSVIMFDRIEMNIYNTNKNKNKEKMSTLKKLIKMFSDNVKLESIETEAGTISADSFELGNMVYLDDAPYSDAEFVFDGSTIKTDSTGEITSIEPVATEEEVALEEDTTTEEVIEEEIATEIAEEAAAVIEEATEEGEVIDYALVIENLTKELESVLEENTALKAKLTKLSNEPAATKLKAVSTNKGKETALDVISRIAKQ